jgi:hypothetical protein
MGQPFILGFVFMGKEFCPEWFEVHPEIWYASKNVMLRNKLMNKLVVQCLNASEWLDRQYLMYAVVSEVIPPTSKCM